LSNENIVFAVIRRCAVPALLAGADYELETIIDLPGGQNIVLARAFSY